MMRCFLSCFGFSSCSDRRNHAVNAVEESPEVNAAVLIQPTHQITAVQESIDWIAQSKIEKEEEESCNKVIVKPIDEVTNSIKETEEVKKTECERDKHEEECSESLFSLSLGSEGKQVSAAEPEVNSPMLQVPPICCTRKDVSKQLQHQVEGEQSEKEAKVENTTKVVEEEEKPNLKEEKVEATPMNHLVPEYRYQDCSEEEYDDTDLYDDDEPPHTDDEPSPSSESLFSLSTDGYRKRNSSAENEKEVSSAMLIQSSIPQVSSVLNPIENVSDVNVVTVRKPTVVEPSLKEDKENINLVDQLEPSSGFLKMKKAMRVDSSFSSWLVESAESTPSKSKYSHEDRPILRALMAEEINNYSSTASSRKSRSPTTPDYDDTPIMGTDFGSSYRTHTRHKKSKSRMNANPNWSSTSVRTRLEPAFQATLNMKKEMRVDNNFSSRLVESESTPPSKSEYIHEDRSILGASTAEEISKYSSTISSRKSRSPTTPDYNDTPIMGTGFGSSYRTHTRQKKSKSRLNANPNWSSTSFRTSLEPAFQATLKMKKEKKVHGSFSSWLVESENSPPSKSKYSHEDRPILGALAAGEISKYSSTTSSRKSRSPTTPDYGDTPIIGTGFGSSYWTHMMHNKSKSRMTEELNWGPTASVRMRLEPAFEATL